MAFVESDRLPAFIRVSLNPIHFRRIDDITELWYDEYQEEIEAVFRDGERVILPNDYVRNFYEARDLIHEIRLQRQARAEAGRV